MICSKKWFLIVLSNLSVEWNDELLNHKLLDIITKKTVSEEDYEPSGLTDNESDAEEQQQIIEDILV